MAKLRWMTVASECNPMILHRRQVFAGHAWNQWCCCPEWSERSFLVILPQPEAFGIQDDQNAEISISGIFKNARKPEDFYTSILEQESGL